MFFCMLDLSLATRWQKPHKCEPKENWYNAVILHRDVRVKVRISLDIYIVEGLVILWEKRINIFTVLL